MSINTGWIKIHRQIHEHWIFKDPVKFKCWIDILFTVNYEDKKVVLGNKLFECKRGQSLLSLASWAKRWRMSKGAARNFLKLLQEDNMVTLESVSKSTRLTVCNYESYQDIAHEPKTQRERTVYTTKEVKKDNNINSGEDHRVFRESEFKKTLARFIKSPANPDGQYSLETVKAFYEFWSEWDTKKNKMAWELKPTWEVAKRLSTWARKEKEYNPKKQNQVIDYANIGN